MNAFPFRLNGRPSRALHLHMRFSSYLSRDPDNHLIKHVVLFKLQKASEGACASFRHGGMDPGGVDLSGG